VASPPCCVGNTALLPSIQDLLNAATADLAQRKVLHLDRDYELIADITGQPVERLKLIGAAE